MLDLRNNEKVVGTMNSTGGQFLGIAPLMFK